MAVDEMKDMSKYCFDIVLDAIQYSNDSTKWSPNNIRRLIISPDGVAIQLHTSQKFIQKPFNREKAYYCFSSMNYKPMITSLVNRVCSSVEEVIFCTGSVNGLSLPQTELELRSILASTKVSQTEEDLLKNIAKRFVRLRGILIFNCTIADFLKTFGTKLNDHLYQCSDDKELSGYASIINVHKDDWYKGYYLRQKDYIFDKEGGTLYCTLHKVQEKIESSLKDKTIDESRKKHLGEVSAKAEDMSQKVVRVLSAYKDIASLMSNNSLVCIYDNVLSNDMLVKALLGVTSGYVLNDSESVLSERFVKFVSKYGVVIKNDKTEDAKQSIMKLTSSLENLYISLYVSLCDNFLDIILKSGSMYPIMTKTKLKGFDRVVFIPSQLTVKAESVNEFLTGTLSGSSVKDSLANICSVISFLAISDASNSGIKKFYKKSAWLEKYQSLGGK